MGSLRNPLTVLKGEVTAAGRARYLIDLNAALKQNDTYRALKQLGSHIITGPTGTNVNDLYLLFVL